MEKALSAEALNESAAACKAEVSGADAVIVEVSMLWALPWAACTAPSAPFTAACTAAAAVAVPPFT